MSELWRVAGSRSLEFDASALDYDRYRPRYPDAVFDDIIELGELSPGDGVIEIGSGTGIASGPLADRRLVVTAVDPSPAMAAVARDRLKDRVTVVVGRFEDWSPNGPVRLVAAFNAWHWVEPRSGLDLAALILPPGGSLALVWTEVVSWGEDPFGERLVEAFGSPWATGIDHVLGSLEPVRRDHRFGPFDIRRHRFERILDADSFVAVTRTYGGTHAPDRDELLRQMIDDDFGGEVTKVEDAVLYLARRL